MCSNKVWFSIAYTYSWYRSNSLTASVACRLLGYDGNFYSAKNLYPINCVLIFYLDAGVFPSYFLDYPQLPVYPLDFSRCSSRNGTLLSCINPNTLDLSPSSEVGISCMHKHQTIGIPIILV